MSQGFKILQGNPYPLGATVLTNNCINFAVVFNTTEECGIVLYDIKTGIEEKIPFLNKNKLGNIYCMKLEGINAHDFEYNFYSGTHIMTDPYAKVIVGNEKWGKIPVNLRAGFVNTEFDWGNDSPIMTNYTDAIFYLLHVRGFTRHSSSEVNKKGTFEGIVEKIPYLKDLGITTIELMPCYEFTEMELPKKKDSNVFSIEKEREPKLNYWGYKEGFYFAPKASYCGHEKEHDNMYSFKNMVKQLHDNGIEVVMQFYFGTGITQAYILEVLKYWVLTYHIDGIHLLGDKIPTALLATEPMLSNTKLLYYDFPLQDIYTGDEIPSYKNLAVCKDDFMYDIRKFLKSDEGQLKKVMHHMTNIGNKMGEVHYITNVNGFTLYDLVSYDRKHNDENDEHNLDGNPYNCSWNCGVEGKTKKKSIMQLRTKQMKNACIFNLLAQSTPFIKSGDEFGNSQNGNNNPYCQDNLISWLNWKELDKNKELYDFIKELIAFRKSNPVLHMDKAFSMMDYLSCGYPDLSYHGEEAWKVETDDLTRHFAMLYCQDYEGEVANQNKKNEFLYIAFNMHWAAHEFALPTLPKGRKWYNIINTGNTTIAGNKDILANQKKIEVEERSIIILIGK